MGRAFLMVLLVVLGATTAAAGPAASTTAGNVQVQLTLNKPAYAIGESIEITLSLTNQGTEESSFQFPTGQMYEFVVLSRGERIWQWSHGRAFTQAFTTLTLKPGEVRVFNARWDQRDTQGRQVSPGEYEIVAVFPAQGGQIRSLPEGPRVSFRIGSEAQIYRPEVASRALTIQGNRVGEVLLDGLPVLRIRAAAGGLSAAERAEIVANRLRRFLDAGLNPAELIVTRVRTEAVIMWRGQLVVTADADHARLNNSTTQALALHWLQSLVHALSGRQ